MKRLTSRKEFLQLQREVVACRRCPRLVKWREQVAREKVKRFAGEDYWGKPIPSLGDPSARLLIVGLAPAAHGANRTGRMFTGDRSGEWLFRALHKAGFANQATAEHRRDGLRLTDCLIAASCRCAPPQNKPTRQEMLNCRPFLLREVALLRNLRVVVALGKIAFDTTLATFGEVYNRRYTPKPRFTHGAESSLTDRIALIASFHPSQQNTFTGRLTEQMLDAIFRRTNRLLAKSR